jgi:hypothetical protein
MKSFPVSSLSEAVHFLARNIFQSALLLKTPTPSTNEKKITDAREVV